MASDDDRKSDDDLSDPVYDLKDAVVYKDYDAIKKLLAEGVDINARDYDEGTALIVAADEGDVNMVKFLLSLGADHTVIDWTEMTPLMYARYLNHHDIVAVLEPLEAKS